MILDKDHVFFIHLHPLLGKKIQGFEMLQTPVFTGDRERIRTSDLPLRSDEEKSKT